MHVATKERVSALRFVSDQELVLTMRGGTLMRCSLSGEERAAWKVGREGMGSWLSRDGRWMAAWHGETKIEVFSTQDGRKAGESPALNGGVRGVAVSSDGSELVYATTDSMLHLWSLSNSAMKWKQRAGLGEAWGIAYSPNGQQLLATNADANVRLHTARNGELAGINETLPISLFDCLYTPDGQWVAAAGAARQIHVFRAAGLQLARTFRREADPVNRIALSGDGKHLAAGLFHELSHRRATKLVVYDFASGNVVKEISTTVSPVGPALAPNARLLAWAEQPTGFETATF
jgi:WD40 repeat protein